jgi:prepilin-type N-terminal cleavage/methylation domain-containing protein
MFNSKLKTNNSKLIGNWKLEIGNSPTVIGAGFSLVEMLVVLVVFSVLAVLATQSITQTLRGSRKSEAQVEVKENVDIAVSTMERYLRNTKGLVSCLPRELTYLDENNQQQRFSCLGGANGYIAAGVSSPLKLTSTEVALVDCTSSSTVFSCTTGDDLVPESITITIKATHAQTSGIEEATVTTSTKVLLRAY